MNNQKYLDSIREQLTMQPVQADNIITEIKAHLQDQYQLHLLNGDDQGTATKKAITEFGKPNEVALRFNKTYRHPLHSFWRITGITLAVYTLIRSLILLAIFSDNTIARHFTLTVGPGFNDKIFSVISCALFGMGAVLMARFMYHYLVKITISEKVTRLTLLLSTITISSYHLVFSFIKFCFGMVIESDYYNGFRMDTLYSRFVSVGDIRIDAVWYYFGSNIVYITATTLVIALVVQLTFWVLGRRGQSYSRVIA